MYLPGRYLGSYGKYCIRGSMILRSEMDCKLWFFKSTTFEYWKFFLICLRHQGCNLVTSFKSFWYLFFHSLPNHLKEWLRGKFCFRQLQSESLAFWFIIASVGIVHQAHFFLTRTAIAVTWEAHERTARHDCIITEECLFMPHAKLQHCDRVMRKPFFGQIVTWGIQPYRYISLACQALFVGLCLQVHS